MSGTRIYVNKKSPFSVFSCSDWALQPQKSVYAQITSKYGTYTSTLCVLIGHINHFSFLIVVWLGHLYYTTEK